MYCQTYYEADVVKETIDQPDICIIRDIESLLLKSANKGVAELSPSNL